MKVITTNRLNRFWKNGILPIKNSLANKLNTSSVVNNLLTTAAGYALDARQGKALDDKITALNGKIVKKTVTFTGTIAPKSTVSVSKDFTMDAGYQYLAAALGYVSNIGALCACCNYTQNKVNLGIYNNHSGNLSYEVSIVISEIKL